ncbi:MAG: bifunctional acetate--CoA ligase family protein/GNAT family N-acetyltransferase [Deltaproteobacteria bacterium]|nr:bifunctional acetate--CoA ligase family protein/GNAT family N-acetyltransferase [Deltaproteobacteria bacterium]
MVNLDRVFRPTSVALVGATDREGTIGHALWRNLTTGRFKGRVYPVNPHRKALGKAVVYPSISAIEAPLDLAVIATPINTVPEVLAACAQKQVGGAIVISAGGKEIGKEGIRSEKEIQKAAAKGKIRIVGPNCMGIIAAEPGLNASFAEEMPLPGRIAFLSQSGAICSAILDLSFEESIGFRYFVSVGSMLDVDFGDLINYFGHDPEVSSILLYIEQLSRVRKFLSAARTVTRFKPIIVLKSGRSPAGAKAASSHTGALAGEDAIYDAAFERAGIIRVDTIQELFDCAELVAKQTPAKGSSLAILTNGGGPGVMAADALATSGLVPAQLESSTIQQLNGVLPSYWSRGNPIDMLGDATIERWRKVVGIMLEAREIQALLIIFVPQALTPGTEVARALVERLGAGPHYPVLGVWMGGKSAREPRQLLNRAGIPTYDTPERAVRAFVHLRRYARELELLGEVPPRLETTLLFDRNKARDILTPVLEKGGGLLTEMESKALLCAYGIPVNPTRAVASAEAAVSAAREMRGPVVMKVLSRQITHKSDIGGVLLNLEGDRAVASAFQKIIQGARQHFPEAEIDGATLQPMILGGEHELIVGAKQDTEFGPVILFGMGGVMTEIFKDRALGLPPLNRLLARRLMEKTLCYQVLKGFRNREAANMPLLEEILIRLSQLLTDLPEVWELDINPLILRGKEAVAVDARVVVTPTAVKAPSHLVISPYPEQYESDAVTRDGRPYGIRPIKPEDASLLIQLFSTLSRKSVYYRFLSPLKALPPQMVSLFTQIDYDRDMALVAVEHRDGEERLLGVARLMVEPGGERGEFAVVIGDSWQGLGIGARLMEDLLAIGKERGMEEIWGLVLPENKTMLNLAQKLGFSIRPSEDRRVYRVALRLSGQGDDNQGGGQATK